MEVFAGVRALEDPETSHSVHLSAISFSYLLYHWSFTDEAFQTLQSIAAFSSREDYPLLASEDPFYVAGLMFLHGRWHDERDLDDAIAWFRRSLARGETLQYHGPVLGAVALCFHRQRKISAALQGYKTSVEQLHRELDQELAEDEPIFDDDLQTQISIFESQQLRITQGSDPNAVLTKYGWAMYSTGEYKYWAPVG